MKDIEYYFQCTTCGKRYSADEVEYRCPECSQKQDPHLPPLGILKTLYPYKKIKSRYKSDKLFDKLKQREFVDLLPIKTPRSLSWLKVGKTPLYDASGFGENKLPHQLLLKDDSQNPTFSYKDRASNLVSAFAREHDINTIAAASTGNAGSSLAGICASQKQKAVIFVPASAPIANLTQIKMYGATIIPVDGTYDDAFDLCLSACEHFGWYNRNTAWNPFTIEGKKIASFEMYQQMKRTIPDRIFVPVGDGVIISGIYKGWEDLLHLGLIEKVPTIVAVQAEGSSNIVNNLTTDQFTSNASNTIADSISVDIPRNFYMAKQFLENYAGEYVQVTDSEILSASKELSSNYGIFTEPASAAAFAGYLNMRKTGKIQNKSKNIVQLTGSGLKDIKGVSTLIDIPAPVKPDLRSLLDSELLNL